MEFIPVITLALVAVLLVLVIVLLVRKPQPPQTNRPDDGAAITALGTLVTQNLREGREAQMGQLSAMDKSLSDKMNGVTDQLGRFDRRRRFFGGRFF